MGQEETFSDSEREDIRRQVDRICKSPPFSSSHRYPALLRYVVEQTLAGHHEHLKERTIGVEAFHRDANYDSNSDPAVRVAATEVRKRLAQYYYEVGHKGELCIELPVGGYVPSFRFTENVATDSGPPRIPPSSGPPRWKPSVWWGAGIGILSVLLLFFSSHLFAPSSTAKPTFAATSSTLDQFWNLFVQVNGSAQMCIGLWPQETWRTPGPGVVTGLSDYKELGKIADLLQKRNKRTLNQVCVIGPEPSQLSGLLGGPVIYVGPHEAIAAKTAIGRFSLEKDRPAGKLWIRDRESTYDKRWHTELLNLARRGEGYAIITFIREGEFQRPLLAIVGSDSVARTGTVELLLEGSDPIALFGNAPPNWPEMNFQAVIETRAGNDNRISAKVVVTHFWK